jgi:glycosyltransferase involved in cell wall biosynthesis
VSKTYFFDVSDIMAYVRTENSISGIQRVSLAVIGRMVERFGPERVQIAFWSEENTYVALSATYLTQMESFDTDRLGLLFFGPKARPDYQIAPTLERYRTRAFKYGVYTWVRHLNAAFRNEAHFAKKGSSIAAWRTFHSARKVARAAPPPPVRPKVTPVSQIAKRGDRVIVMGAVFGMEKLTAGLAELNEKHGVDTSILVYDLIPILVPEHMNGGYSHAFESWLKTSASYCKSYLAISEYTSKDLGVFLEKNGTPRPIDVVPLAQYFERPAVSDRAKLSDQIKGILKEPYVLVVGTMETRKNLLRLAQAWQQLIAVGALTMPRLVFAGKENWHRPEFKDFLAKTKNLDGMIEIVHKPSDADLTALYEGCLFTAMVSVYEGWGLPIGESLSMGKTGVVGRSTSMPEVGGDMVEYCDVLDVDDMAAACARLIGDTDHRIALEAKIAATELRTWDDVTADFLRFLEGERAD